MFVYFRILEISVKCLGTVQCEVDNIDDMAKSLALLIKFVAFHLDCKYLRKEMYDDKMDLPWTSVAGAGGGGQVLLPEFSN